MEVKLSRTGRRTADYAIVKDWAVAARVVREFIDAHNLGSGCSEEAEAFTGGQVFDNGTLVGRISYNGRAWDLNGKEVAL